MHSDRELVRRVIDGSVEAADEFVDRFARFVYSILQRNLGFNRENADELFQDFFARLWEDDCRRLRLWRGEGDLAAYLAPIVRNLGLGHLRKHAKTVGPESCPRCVDEPAPEPFESLLDPEPTPEEEAAVREQRRQLARAVERLRPRDRELYRLRYQEQLSYRDMADRMDMTVNHVGVALTRLEQRLVQLVADIGNDTRPHEAHDVAVRTTDPRASVE